MGDEQAKQAGGSLAIVNPVVDDGRFSAITLASTTELNGEAKKLLKANVLKLFTDKGVSDVGAENCLGLLLYTLAMTGTTAKYSPPGDELVFQTTVANVTISLTWSEFRAVMNADPHLKKHVNKLRVFARTFAEEYLNFTRNYKSEKQLPEIPRANRLGIPAEFSYAAADFLLTTSILPELEQAVLLNARNNAVRTDVSDHVPITSLDQLGRKRI
ncbi:major coat protein [Soybean leaf crinkle mottle virus]|nr:major coat protein [Soybean leaf crinkle mottle virus]